MLNPSDICPKCEGQMLEGFIMDRAHGGGQLVSRWVAGIPESKSFLGFKVSHLINVIGKVQYPIQSFRCSRCGYLESYANAPAGT